MNKEELKEYLKTTELYGIPLGYTFITAYDTEGQPFEALLFRRDKRINNTKMKYQVEYHFLNLDILSEENSLKTIKSEIYKWERRIEYS